MDALQYFGILGLRGGFKKDSLVFDAGLRNEDRLTIFNLQYLNIFYAITIYNLQWHNVPSFGSQEIGER